MGLSTFLRDRNDFAANTKFGIVLEFFCRIEVGLRIFLSEEKREQKLNRNFCPRRRKKKGSWN